MLELDDIVDIRPCAVQTGCTVVEFTFRRDYHSRGKND